MKWRPAPAIRVKALGLLWREAHLLCAEVPDDQGQTKGLRPLGGTVAFGESWRTALVREFREELGVTVAISGPQMVLENLYTHEGAPGHEVLFIADVTCAAPLGAGLAPIAFQEHDGTPCQARWVRPDDTRLPLYPEGLRAHLKERTHLP